MDADSFWKLFLDTGAPEFYLLYQRAVQGACHVLENRRFGSAGDGI